jgi:hypothetical protein
LYRQSQPIQPTIPNAIAPMKWGGSRIRKVADRYTIVFQMVERCNKVLIVIRKFSLDEGFRNVKF